MRRVFAMLLALSLLLGGCSFAPAADAEGTPAAFYYAVRDAETLSADETVASEQRNTGVLSLGEFLGLYLAGPRSEELASPFPPGTSVLDVQYTDDVLTLKVSGALFTLTGVDLSLALCCLANTVCAYTGRETVLLTDETGSIRMELQPGKFLLSSDLPDETMQSFTLYFADSQLRYLASETRTVALSRNETEAAYVMRKLLEGPESGQLRPVIPAGTELRGVTLRDGICMVDLSAAFLARRGAAETCLAIYGVVNTLTGLDGVEAVQFLVEGAPVERYGLFPLDEPVSRYVECIGPVRAASGEMDVNLYVRSETGESFAAPCRVKQTISQPQAQAVLEKLLSFEPPQGFYNPIPYGTELLNISVSGGVCYVDVSDKLIPQEDTEEAEGEAVWALVTTLTELDAIRAVSLTIAGESGGLQYVDIAEPMTAEDVLPE